MAGNLAIQVFVNSTLNLKGVNTQAVATDGSATFRSLGKSTAVIHGQQKSNLVNDKFPRIFLVNDSQTYIL